MEEKKTLEILCILSVAVAVLDVAVVVVVLCFKCSFMNVDDFSFYSPWDWRSVKSRSVIKSGLK